MESMKTGQDLRSWRKENKLCQKEFAEMANYSHMSICHIEKKDTKLSKKLLEEIERIDKELHPPVIKSPISEKMDYLKQYSSIYNEELNTIENAISKLLNINIDKNDLDYTTAYLQFISKSLSALAEVKSTPFEDTEEGKKPVKKKYVKLQGYAFTFFRRIKK